MSTPFPRWRHRRMVPAWLAGRRYGVPAWMIADATVRRLAGDWRGACAAAAIDVHVDLNAVRRRHGSELAHRVELDLLHFVPDLVRWHVPRSDRETGEMDPERILVLTRYPEPGGERLLFLRTPTHVDGPQRLSLHWGTVREATSGYKQTWWDQARHLWDARVCDEFLVRVGGGDRLPFHTRDGRQLTNAELPGEEMPDRHADPVAWTEWTILLEDAGYGREVWEPAGIAVDWDRLRADSSYFHDGYFFGEGRVSALRHNLDRVRPPRVTRALLEHPWHPRLALTAEGPDGYTLTWGEDGGDVIPRAWWLSCPDLELLRAGYLSDRELHPLVRTALFPDASGDGYTAPPVDIAPGRVRCGGAWHELKWERGKLTSVADHETDEGARERALRALGAQGTSCAEVIGAWEAGRGHLPRRLHRLRSHARALARHGDVRGLTQLLDAGVDLAGVQDRDHRNLLFDAAAYDDAEFVWRLVSAGLDVDRIGDGLTPLAKALRDRASVPVIRALFEGGADPTRKYFKYEELARQHYGDAVDFLFAGRKTTVPDGGP